MSDMSAVTVEARASSDTLSDAKLTEVWESIDAIEEEDGFRECRNMMGANPHHLRKRLLKLGLMTQQTKGNERLSKDALSVEPKQQLGKDITAEMTADEYAKKVISGDIVACENVILACKRHMEDHKRDDVYFDYEMEKKVLAFGREQIILEDGTLLRYYPWQIFVMASLLCWMRIITDEDTGATYHELKYQRAYIETGKSSGKTPLVSIIALWVFITRRDKAAQVYFAANEVDQARIAFNDFAWSILRNKKLKRNISVLGGNPPNYVRFNGKQSFAKMLAQKVSGRGLSGIRPDLVVADELHEWNEKRGESMIQQIENSLSKRDNAMLLIITNSGETQSGPCWDYHNMAIDVVHGKKQSDGLFSYVCSLDDGDDYADSKVWKKTNPSLPARPRIDRLQEHFDECVGSIKKLRGFRRYYTCEWLSSNSPYISMDIVDGIMPRPPRDDEGKYIGDTLSPPEERQRGILYFGIDLGETVDFTALSRVWLMPDGKVEAAVDLWSPGDTLRERALADNAPYEDMVAQGFLDTTPGGYVRWDYVARKLKGYVNHHGYQNIYGLAYDPFKFPEFNTEAHKIGLPIDHIRSNESLFAVVHPPHLFRKKSRDPDVPSLFIGRSLDILEQWAMDGRIKLRFNPMLRRAFEGCEVKTGEHGGRTFEKKDKQKSRIDSLVALVYGCGLLDGYENMSAMNKVSEGE